MSSDYDVIVVGFGFAGGIAAIEAHDSGVRVLLIDKQLDPGGISVCSAGGVRIAGDADAAFAYLVATNAGTAPEPLLRVLAEGMTGLADYVRGLAAPCEAAVGIRESPANYPLPGYETFGFAYVDDIPGFDPVKAYPQVRGSPAGALLFRLVEAAVARRPGIEVRLGCRARRLVRGADGTGIEGVALDRETVTARRGVVLACGGFESDPEMQRQTWQLKPVLSAAVRQHTGDGVRMAQAVGAGLWHMWHFHGSYGFRDPDPAYPFGIRVKRLPDWIPGHGLREDVVMTWILVDQTGRRFMNEYEPYMQDTGHRPFEVFDTVTQTAPRVPAFLVTDEPGRRRYPLTAPTWHDREVAARFGAETPAARDARILRSAPSLAALAEDFGIPGAALERSVANWNAACEAGGDADFGRPPGSMMPIATAPFHGAAVWPVVSNTQGGPMHDERQRVLDAFGAPIPGLFAAGELGSVFGHLYMSGGNLAECFVGGRIAGCGAAGIEG
jgi:succinate dehydrogenase/fumarate reductase flavoprotein subunit